MTSAIQGILKLLVDEGKVTEYESTVIHNAWRETKLKHANTPNNNERQKQDAMRLELEAIAGSQIGMQRTVEILSLVKEYGKLRSMQQLQQMQQQQRSMQQHQSASGGPPGAALQPAPVSGQPTQPMPSRPPNAAPASYLSQFPASHLTPLPQSQQPLRPPQQIKPPLGDYSGSSLPSVQYNPPNTASTLQAVPPVPPDLQRNAFSMVPPSGQQQQGPGNRVSPTLVRPTPMPVSSGGSRGVNIGGKPMVRKPLMPTADSGAAFPLASLSANHNPMTQEPPPPAAPPSFDDANDIEPVPRAEAERSEGVTHYSSLDSAEVQTEEQRLRSSLRAAIAKPRPPAPDAISKPVDSSKLWETSYILNKAKASELANKVLMSANFKIKADALLLLSEGVQERCRALMEMAVANSRKGRNISAHTTYKQICQGLSATGGVAGPGTRANLGLMFGPDVKAQLVAEEISAREDVRDAVWQAEKRVFEELKADDEERAAKRRNKDKSDVAATWWEIDREKERNGEYSWEELAEAHRREAVAMRFQLGPHVRKKRADNVDISFPERPVRKSTLIQAQQSQQQTSPVPSAAWRPQPFPLSSKGAEVVTRDDMLAALLKVARPAAGGPYSLAVGLSARKALLVSSNNSN